MVNVLFHCATNSCLSQMAEGFALARGRTDIAVFSAGPEAKPVHPLAVQVMSEAGVDISGQKSKAVRDFAVQNLDLAVSLTDEAARSCPVLPGNPMRLAWNIPDPSSVSGGSEAAVTAFRQARDEIRRLVNELFDHRYLDVIVQAKHRADLVIQSVSEGIVEHDLNRKIFYMNEAAERITGYRKEEVVNRDCWDVFPGGLCGGRCVFSEGNEAVVDAHEETLEITTRKGERRRVVCVLRSLLDGQGNRTGIMAVFRDLTREYELSRRLGEIQQFSGIVGRDEKMLAVFDLIRDLSDSNVPVLIQGDSGTGKELIAAAIHNEGPRANKPFVAVNCGALPEGLLESELFGHVRGAFTGAIRDKKGRFELADGGTIFLDEIGDISLAMQVKLLRVLQEGRFERVGSEKTLKVDVRVISATHRHIDKEIASGRFREDLYYRLSVVPINVPPLRERRNDIPLLAQHILKRVLKESKRHNVYISPEVLDVMLSYDWPGNVRELQNWIQFALVKCKGAVITLDHLPPVGVISPPIPESSAWKKKLDVESVRNALQAAAGNKVEAARALGVSRATLYRFLDSARIKG